MVLGAANSDVCDLCEVGTVSKAGASICINCVRGQFILKTNVFQELNILMNSKNSDQNTCVNSSNT